MGAVHNRHATAAYLAFNPIVGGDRFGKDVDWFPHALVLHDWPRSKKMIGQLQRVSGDPARKKSHGPMGSAINRRLTPLAGFTFHATHSRTAKSSRLSPKAGASPIDATSMVSDLVRFAWSTII